MTEDLRPKSHLSLIMSLIGVAGAVWGATTWLNSRADTNQIEKLSNAINSQKIDMAVMRGDLKAVDQRLGALDEKLGINQKLDTIINDRRRR